MAVFIFSQLVNLAVAIICTFLVNTLGVPLQQYGYKTLDQWMDNDDRLFNVAYRTAAPVVIWCLFSAGIASAWDEFQIELAWTSLIYYWAIRLGLTILLRPNSLAPLSFLLRSATSITLAAYFCDGLELSGWQSLVPQHSDVVFQFWVVAAAIAMKTVASVSTKDVDLEPYYFEVKKAAEKRLPKRFQEDVALKITFYAIAITEAYYRPRTIRRIENLLARVGIAKTTGIMQVKSKIPLSDEESVDMAVPIIEKLWDSFLESNDCFRVKKKTRGYSYCLDDAIESLYAVVPLIYRKYCGSSKINCEEMILEAEEQVLADLMITDTGITVRVTSS